MTNGTLPFGPYLINTKTGVVFSVARLYSDPLHAFLGGGIIHDAATQKYKSSHTNVSHSTDLTGLECL